MRRFPSVSRALGDALGFERLPNRPGWLGEREVRLDRYDAEFEGDWTIGSFMLARREAIERAGLFDERFFVYSEEVDLCLRVRQAGWKIVHLPTLTILHEGSAVRAVDPRMARQNAYAQLQYARKHLTAPERAGYRAALLLRYGLRSVPPVGDGARRAAARAAAGAAARLRRAARSGSARDRRPRRGCCGGCAVSASSRASRRRLRSRRRRGSGSPRRWRAAARA